MGQMPLLMKEIQQRDRYHFLIRWNDGKESVYHLAHLQRNCPCRRCWDDQTKTFTKDRKPIAETLLARRIMSVGNYAIRIEFVQGCCQGIYTVSFLRRLSGLDGGEQNI